MAFSNDDIQRVREASDIVEIISQRVPLRQRGRDFWCCCPFHEEKTPSCKVDPATQLFYCFGCHKGGDVFKFVQEIEGIDFPDAVRRLADRAHIELQESGKRGPSLGERSRLKELCKQTAEYYHLMLMRGKSSSAQEARQYLGSRSFGGDVAKRWQLGFAPGKGELVSHLRKLGFTPKEMIDANVAMDRNGRVSDRFYNRVMFPIFDEVGDCIAFGGRVMGDAEPKYLNSTTTPLFNKKRTLYALDKAKAAITATGVAIVVEGYTDVIACHEAGVTNVVATLGTALSKHHIRSISRHATKKIVYLFDGDKAGQNAADRALEFIGETIEPESGKRTVDLVACTLPDNLDPADFIAQYGAAALREQVETARPLIQFGIERRIASHNTDTAEGRSAAVADALSVLAPIKDTLLAKQYAVQIAGRLHIRENDVIDRLAQLVPPRLYNEEDYERPDNESSNTEPQPYIELSEEEVSRRAFEENLLSVCVRHPELVNTHATSIAGINWHSESCAQAAAMILERVANNPLITPTELVPDITQAQPQFARIFATTPDESVNPSVYVAYAIEELSINDLEDAIQTYRSQLANSENLSEEDANLLFESVVALQKELSARRLAHSNTTLQ